MIGRAGLRRSGFRLQPFRAWAAIALLGLLGAGACAPATKKPALPAAGSAPKYPDFVFPSLPAGLAAPAAAATHESAWQWLQAGDLRTAEKNFTSALKRAPDFYPSEAGLGYVALARKDGKAAASHFDRALAADPAYAPALAGRGEALLALGERDRALSSFEAAVAADPKLANVRSRIDVLRFRGIQDNVAAARKAADAGHLDDARAIYERTLAMSPDSAFLYRELAVLDRRAGHLDLALVNAQKAADLNSTEARNFITLAETHEARGEYAKAADAYGAAVALEPDAALDRRIDDLREKAAFSVMPDEYRSIETASTITRAQLAALFGVHLDDLLKRAQPANAVLMTDTRGSWASPWILSVSRAGIMEAYPNHTFQPNALVRRGDLAQTIYRTLLIIAAERPRPAGAWRNARERFADLPPGHPGYPAASAAVASGVMSTPPDGAFQSSRPVTGAEAMAAVRKLEELSGRIPR